MNDYRGEFVSHNLERWNSRLRWRLTQNGNWLRVVKNDYYGFLVVPEPDRVKALYRHGNEGWITVAVVDSIEAAKAALFPYAEEAGVPWA